MKLYFRELSEMVIQVLMEGAQVGYRSSHWYRGDPGSHGKGRETEGMAVCLW